MIKIKVLHAALMINPTSGILNQMNWEQSAAADLALSWDTRVFCPNKCVDNSDITIFSKKIDVYSGKSVVKKAFTWTLLRFEYYRWLREQIPHYDVILLRYHVHDPLQVWFVSHCNKPVYFVHHTLEVPELTGGGLLGKLRALAENWIGPSSLRRAHASIGVTPEIARYQIARLRRPSGGVLVYPNGIELKNQLTTDARGIVPEILFIASYFSAWHGLDLLLDALDKNSENIILHLVGDLSDADLERACKNKRIRLHGGLKSVEIEKLTARCWIGLSSFALDRKGMEEACTLKVREYLAHGLPVFSGHRDVFPIRFPFYKIGSPDLNEIVGYCHEVGNISRETVAKEAAPFIDKNVLLKNLYTSLSEKMKKE